MKGQLYVALALAFFFVLLPCLGCTRPVQPVDKVTLALVDRGLFDKDYRDVRDREYREFTATTGIHVQLLPGPESAFEQLKLWQKLLGNGPETLRVHPDVFGLDVIWPGILADDLLDLKPYVAQDVAEHFPELISNWTVNGRLVALPSRLDAGVLYYRLDLLQRYGYQAPPGTWDELERMAARIQNGERATGRKNFWGFVWQGAVSEALTCNALEWQVSEGGGRIIESDGSVSVNNAQAIRSWERAARWVGTISPPGITTYKETDATNLWVAGDAAFMRNWTGAYVASESDTSVVKNHFGVSLLPRGQGGRAEVVGGDGYGVSRRSAHPKEAIALVRYLSSRGVQALRARMLSTPPTMQRLYSDKDLLKDNRQIAEIQQAVSEGLVARPSTLTARNYTEISATFANAVHSVLLRQKTGVAAALDLEKQLNQIMGATRQAGGPVRPRDARIPNAAQK
jgi:trehalose/maltose transport system substrate-binding protein